MSAPVFEKSKLKLWKKYSNLMASETPATTAPSPTIIKERLFYYATQGLLEKLDKKFLDSALDFINLGDDKDNHTPLMCAAKNGHFKVVYQLIKVARADTDTKAAWNESTALMVAAECGYDKVVSSLITLHADMNLRNSFQNTALMLAAELGKKAVVGALLSHDDVIEKDTKNRYEDTALILAASNGHKECVDLLIRAGADLNLSNKFGKTALIVAAENGYHDVVNSLVTNSTQGTVNIVSKRGLSAIMLAASKGHLDIVKCLTLHGADIHRENNDRTDNVLTYACLGGKAAIVVHLVNLGADVNYQNINGDTVLMRACEHANEETMDQLLSHYTQKQVITALTVQNKEGLTCLMKACRTGNLKVIVYLMDLLKNHLLMLSNGDINGTISFDDEGDEDNKGDGGTSPLGNCIPLEKNTSVRDIFNAYYKSIANEDGDTAATLLASYYWKHPHDFVDFVMKATSAAKPNKMYLFDMLPLPAIVPKFDNPSTVLNACKGKLFRNLSEQQGFKADVLLIHTLVNLAATLKIVAIQHPLERDIFLLYDRVEEALKQCMNSNSMDVPLNVMKVLRDPDNVETDTTVIVRQALAFLNGPLKLCIKHDLTGLLGTAQISSHVRTVFWASLKPTKRTIIREFSDLFQIRSGCTTYRYRPVFMFFFKCLSKIMYLVLVAYVSAEEDCVSASLGNNGMRVGASQLMGNMGQSGWNVTLGVPSAPNLNNQCATYDSLNFKEGCIVLMLITGFMFELGEIIDRGGIVAHYNQAWNLIDLARNVLVGMWFICRLSITNNSIGRGFLAISAVPMSIGLLRFLSIFKHLGQLVVMIFAMSQELISFLVVFLMSILGFGIAFHSLFPDIESYSSSGATVLTLFDAALGGHEFQSFQGHKYQDVGIAVMIVYVAFVVIILLNLVIARMSCAHEKMNEKSFELWCMVYAKTVQDFLLIKEKRTPLCMLPPPLNIISTAVFPWDRVNRWLSSGEEEIVSICGTVSDRVIGLLMAPFCAAVEIVLVNYEIWCSPVPQYNAVLVTVFSVILFPCWYLLFFLLILAHLYQLESTRISRHTKLLVYATTPKDTNLSTILFLAYLPLRFIHFVDGLVSAAYAYKAADNNTTTANTTTIIGKIYSNARIFFFVLTSPMWVFCVCVVRVMQFVGLGNMDKSDQLLSGGGGQGLVGQHGTGRHYDAKQFSMCEKETDTDDNTITTTNYNDPPDYPTNNNLPGGGGGGGASTGGIMSLTFLRLTVSDAKIGFLGRKPNVLVRVTYGAHVEVLPLFNRGWYGGSWALNVEMTFQLTDATSSLLLEVYDKDVADVSCKSCSGDSPAVAGVILARSVVDIREWIANRTFEDECKLRNRHGLDTGDRVQLVVKITYPEGVSAQSSNSFSLPPGLALSSLSSNAPSSSGSSSSSALPLYERYIHGLPSAKNPNELPGTGGTNKEEKEEHPLMPSRESMLSTGGSFRRPPLSKANSLERKGAPTPAVNASGGLGLGAGLGVSGPGSFLERTFSNNEPSTENGGNNTHPLNITMASDLMGVRSNKQRAIELTEDVYPGRQIAANQESQFLFHDNEECLFTENDRYRIFSPLLQSLHHGTSAHAKTPLQLPFSRSGSNPHTPTNSDKDHHITWRNNVPSSLIGGSTSATTASSSSSSANAMNNANNNSSLSEIARTLRDLETKVARLMAEQTSVRE